MDTVIFKYAIDLHAGTRITLPGTGVKFLTARYQHPRFCVWVQRARPEEKFITLVDIELQAFATGYELIPGEWNYIGTDEHNGIVLHAYWRYAR